MEYQLNEERYAQYKTSIQAAQEAEANIGSLTYKLYKFNKLREEIDESIKLWWDQVIKEMNLDPKRSFMITKDGLIKDVTPETKQEDVKEQTVQDLK